jgi:hypothetical protein
MHCVTIPARSPRSIKEAREKQIHAKNVVEIRLRPGSGDEVRLAAAVV